MRETVELSAQVTVEAADAAGTLVEETHGPGVVAREDVAPCVWPIVRNAGTTAVPQPDDQEPPVDEADADDSDSEPADEQADDSEEQ